jgi:hypothetical protein
MSRPQREREAAGEKGKEGGGTPRVDRLSEPRGIGFPASTPPRPLALSEAPA